MAAWTKRNLTWFIASYLPDFGMDQRGLIVAAFAGWAKVCNLHFAEAADAESADIVIDTISGNQSGIPAAVFGLAVTSPQPGAGIPPTIRFNTDWSWFPARYAEASAHELGHALGLEEHSSDPADLMYRSQHGVTVPQPGDITRIQALYGPPATDVLFPPHKEPAMSPIPQHAIDQITKTRGVLASVKTYLDGEKQRHQDAIDAALALGATEAQLAPVQEAVDAMAVQSDDVAAAIAANP